MPTLWRYILFGYLRVFCLSVCTFIAVLIVSRFKDIARFGALSADATQTLLFVVYQIPLILPIAIPLSALIASLLLFQRLSRTFELTALRASGVSLTTLVAPLLLFSLLLSLGNFSFCAEIAPFCRRESKTLLYRKSSSNPLLLLQRQNLIKIKNAYLNMDGQEDEKSAKNFFLIAHNESNQRLFLFSARQLRIRGAELLGYDVALVSHSAGEKKEEYDPLIIENQSKMSTGAPLLSAALKKSRPHLDANALDLRMLRIRSSGIHKLALAAVVEIWRRISLALAPFSLTLLGIAYGMQQGRTVPKKTVWIAVSLTLMLLTSYFLGKGLKTSPFFAKFVLLLPHPIVWTCCLIRLHRFAKGVLA